MLYRIVDKTYIQESLGFNFADYSDIKDSYIERVISASHDWVEGRIDQEVSTEAEFHELSINQQDYLRKAVGHLALENIRRTVPDGGSMSSSAGGLSYSETTTKPIGFVPEVVLRYLEMTGLYNRTSVISGEKADENQIFWINGVDEAGFIRLMMGQVRVVGYDNLDAVIRGILAEGAHSGDSGESGEKGDKGDPGDTGAQGIQGLSGEKGDQGEVGATGHQGTRGIQGETGSRGAHGSTGATGIQGIQGIKGDAGGGGLFYSLQDEGDITSTGPYRQSQTHGGHNDTYHYFFKAESIEGVYNVSEEVFGTGGKKKYWVQFTKAGIYTLSGHFVVRFQSQQAPKYYYMHIHEHTRVAGTDVLGDVEHKFENETSIQVSIESGEANFMIKVIVSEDDLNKEYIWSTKAEVKIQRGVSLGTATGINDVNINRIDSPSYMFLMPTFEGLSGPKGDTGEKGETGDDGTDGADGADGTGGLTDAERTKITTLGNVVGAYEPGVIRATLVTRVEELEDQEITTVDIARTGTAEGDKGTQKGLNTYYNTSIKELKKAVFLPDGAGILDREGAYLKPSNYLENNHYFLFKPLANVGSKTAGGLTVATNSVGNKTRHWVSFSTAGYYSVKFRLTVLFNDAIADGTISDVRLVQHEKVGADTEGAGTSTIKSTKSVFRFLSKWSTTIDIEALTHISNQTVTAGNRYFTWSLKFNKIRLSDSRLQADTISEINTTESHFMSLELVSKE